MSLSFQSMFYIGSNYAFGLSSRISSEYKEDPIWPNKYPLCSLILCCKTPKSKLRSAVLSEEVEFLRNLSSHQQQNIHQQAVHLAEQERERERWYAKSLIHLRFTAPMCHRTSDYKQGLSWWSTSSTPRTPLEVPFEDYKTPVEQRPSTLPHLWMAKKAISCCD